MRSSKYTEHYTDTFITFKEIMRTVSNIYHNCVPDKIKNRRNTDQLKQRDTVIIACVIWGIINGYTSLAKEPRIERFVPSYFLMVTFLVGVDSLA
ncbi:hypothetical protein EB19_02233 [Enterococcus faecium]|uniref:IS982 family transposase n=1 Tax=Enterococcus faecium TaxID=1352 RepID=A0A3F3NPU6_ENTFC|nr:hypothetical protein EB12_01649 [Enterococcus faecium]RBS31492.1 hypothetical protein EB12_01677 [Enterococcus faecium]RBS38680.1 hypothetical protein EB19_02233 [Enterococcus faecium]RBS47632.1 hypothetical protein EB21_01578 [Enterococcus faecium]RBS52722.1 hypothetical protein EB33_03063 [Enterococcus faecium]